MTARIELAGEQFGKWTVLHYTRGNRWLCLCDCGTQKAVTGLSLRDGRSTSCGCRRKDWRRHDLTGQRFGLLTVIAKSGTRNCGSGNRSTFLCRCDCGNKKTILGSSLVSNKTKSCGCFHPGRTHGEAGKETAEYRSWASMMSRCKNPNHQSWNNYGGRGIKVCERWKSYKNFLEDMGRKPTPQHTIDRYPNVDGNYEPDNCRWANKKQQIENRRPFKVRRIENFTTAEIMLELSRRT